MQQGRVVLRSLGQPREQGRLVKREFLRGLAEIEFRGGFETIDAVPQKNLIGIQRENLCLGEPALDLNGQQSFLDLAMEGTVGRKEKIAGQLHRQSRGTLNGSSKLEIASSSGHHPRKLESGMRFEVLVFNGKNSVIQHFWKVFVLRHRATLQGEGSERTTSVVVKHRVRNRAIVTEVTHLGKIHI